MGLLDQILGGVAGGAGGARGGGGLGDILGGAAGGGLGGLGGMAGRAGIGGGKSQLLMLLLPLVLQMLNNRGGAAGGGLGGLLEQLTQRGFGAQAQSWVSTGPNQPVPPSALDGLFGADQVAALAAQAGVSDGEVRAGLSELLPEVVDRLTPAGQVPAQDELLAGVDDFIGRMGSR